MFSRTIDYYYFSFLDLFPRAQKPVMQWRLGAARRIQALPFLLSHKLDASRHFLANFFAVSNHFWHLNFTDCLGGEGFALDSNYTLQALSKPFLFLSQYVPQTRITLAQAVSPTPPAKKSLGTFQFTTTSLTKTYSISIVHKQTFYYW